MIAAVLTRFGGPDAVEAPLLGSSMCTRKHFARLDADAVAGNIRPLVAARYDLADVRAAQAAFERREHVGKLVLEPPAEH